MNINSAPVGRRFGCLTYGCGFACVLIVCLIGGLGFYFVKSVRSAFYQYSSTEAPVMEVRIIDASTIQAAEQKWRRLVGALETKTSYSTDFSSDELMGLLNRGEWKSRFDLILAGDIVSARFAFPLTALGEWQAAELLLGSSITRYINGSFKAGVSATDGKATVRFDELTLNGHALEDMARGHASQWISGAINAQIEGPGQGRSDATSIRVVINELDLRDGKLFVGLSAQPGS